MSVPGANPDRDAVQTTLDYHGRISQAMTVERTALASALIPVTPYIIVSAIEAYRRYPEMMRTISGYRRYASIADTMMYGVTGMRAEASAVRSTVIACEIRPW